jgi:hypothetical protein
MQQMARKPFMKPTMMQQAVAVKSRKTAAFATQMLAPCLMVNHY